MVLEKLTRGRGVKNSGVFAGPQAPAFASAHLAILAYPFAMLRVGCGRPFGLAVASATVLVYSWKNCVELGCDQQPTERDHATAGAP